MSDILIRTTPARLRAALEYLEHEYLPVDVRAFFQDLELARQDGHVARMDERAKYEPPAPRGPGWRGIRSRQTSS